MLFTSSMERKFWEKGEARNIQKSFETCLYIRVSVEHARGTRRDRSRDRYRGGDRGRGDSRAPWLDKYGPPTRTDYRVVVENLSTRVSWQVGYMMSDGRVG